MRSQSLLIEYILFFIIGISICSSIILSFDILKSNIRSTVVYDQFREMADFITSSILSISDQSGISVMKLAIPKQLALHQYKIELDNEKISIISLENPNIIYIQNIYNIDKRYKMNGLVISSENKYCFIKKNEYEIKICGEI